MLILLWVVALTTGGVTVWLMLRLLRVEAHQRDDAALWKTVQDELLRHAQRLDERRQSDSRTTRTRRPRSRLTP